MTQQPNEHRQDREHREHREHRGDGRRRGGIAVKPGREVLVAVIGVLVTVAGLAWAGAAASDGSGAAAVPPRSAVTGRTFVCAGDLPATRALHGSIGRPAHEQRITKPLAVDAPRSRAADAYAGRYSRQGGSLAVSSCPEPANEFWFVGAGASVRHDTTLLVDNPRPGSAIVDITVYGPQGRVKAPGLRGITVAGHSSRTFDLTRVAPANGEVAAHVTTSRGLVSVSASDRYTLGGIGKVATEWVPDQGAASRTVRLVGLPPRADTAYLVVANPGDVDAVVDLEVVGAKGPFAPSGHDSVTVPPESVQRLEITDAFDGSPATLEISSHEPVVATVRTVRKGDLSLAAAAQPLQGTSVFALPPEAHRDLTLRAVRRDAALTLRSYGEKGRRLGRKQLHVGGDTSTLVPLPAKARYASLTASRPDAVAGVLVRSDGAGTSAMSIPPAVEALLLPAVEPGW